MPSLATATPRRLFRFAPAGRRAERKRRERGAGGVAYVALVTLKGIMYGLLLA